MRVGIVSGNAGWHVQDLERAAKLLDMQTERIDITRLSSADDLQQYDALLIRTFPAGTLEQTIFRLALLYRAERSGMLVLNAPGAFEACVDKFSTTARLQAAGILTPATICCQTLEAAMTAYEHLGGEVVIKPIFGSEGKGLIRVSDRDSAWRACSMLCQLGAVIYLQDYVHHAGHDLRAFVLGGKVLAAMQRHHSTDWRTNLARGAVAERVELTAEQQDLAIRAAECVGAEMAGVDIIEGVSPGSPPVTESNGKRNHGSEPLILEVNGVPGWQGLSAVTGIDIAVKVLEYVRNRAVKHAQDRD